MLIIFKMKIYSHGAGTCMVWRRSRIGRLLNLLTCLDQYHYFSFIYLFFFGVGVLGRFGDFQAMQPMTQKHKQTDIRTLRLNQPRGLFSENVTAPIDHYNTLVRGVQCVLFSAVLTGVQCVLFSVQCAVCSVHCVLCSVQCTVYTVQCVVCSVQCAVCSVQCVLCSMHFGDATRSFAAAAVCQNASEPDMFVEGPQWGQCRILRTSHLSPGARHVLYFCNLDLYQEYNITREILIFFFVYVKPMVPLW